ncbi:MAG: hypothetical protein BGO77_03190 [Caedibacter sp. 37-49]|nr:MAG: hypothetical protein BGO77_03190 [Caedibacter sp. 37-49]
METLFTMSHQEISRLEILQKLLDRKMNQLQAAELLHLSTRQVQRLLRAYRLQGIPGLISTRRGKPSNRALPQTVKEYALELIRSHYADFGPTLAREKLYEKHDLKLAVETVRGLMIKADLWIPHNKRLKRAYQPRYRREKFGELIQIDGSTHHWFEDRGPKCTLLVYVDDATSQLTSLYFTSSESTHTYFLATKQHIENHGKPIAFYSDRLSVFKVHSKSTQEKIMTQFGRALYELNIDLLCANSCQAKGRVERANKTLQDRLVKELRLRSISTIAEANAYMPEFMKDYNKRFAKVPLQSGDSHRPLQKYEVLDEILCFKQERTVSNSLTIQHDRILYLIEDTVANRSLRRKKIMLHEYPDGHLNLYYKGRLLRFKKLYDRVHQPIEQGTIVPNERIASVLEFIKATQDQREKKRRSTRALRKMHLDILPSSQEQQTKLNTTSVFSTKGGTSLK